MFRISARRAARARAATGKRRLRAPPPPPVLPPPPHPTTADRESGGIAGGEGREKGQIKMGQVKYNLTFGILEFVW